MFIRVEDGKGWGCAGWMNPYTLQFFWGNVKHLMKTLRPEVTAYFIYLFIL